jgi:phage FluMu protein Com
MEEGTKKVVSVVVIVVCLAAAGVIIYRSMGGGGAAPGAPAGKTWVKCNNPKCGHEYEMDQKEYQAITMKQGGRYVMMYGVPAIKCPKCNEESVYAATKCEKCGKIFFPGSVEGAIEDKCPGCGYSKTEEAIKNTKTGG